jgi:hypothetical protein
MLTVDAIKPGAGIEVVRAALAAVAAPPVATAAEMAAA